MTPEQPTSTAIEKRSNPLNDLMKVKNHITDQMRNIKTGTPGYEAKILSLLHSTLRDDTHAYIRNLFATQTLHHAIGKTAKKLYADNKEVIIYDLSDLVHSIITLIHEAHQKIKESKSPKEKDTFKKTVEDIISSIFAPIMLHCSSVYLNNTDYIFHIDKPIFTNDTYQLLCIIFDNRFSMFNELNKKLKDGVSGMIEKEEGYTYNTDDLNIQSAFKPKPWINVKSRFAKITGAALVILLGYGAIQHIPKNKDPIAIEVGTNKDKNDANKVEDKNDEDKVEEQTNFISTVFGFRKKKKKTTEEEVIGQNPGIFENMAGGGNKNEKKENATVKKGDEKKKNTGKEEVKPVAKTPVAKILVETQPPKIQEQEQEIQEQEQEIQIQEQEAPSLPIDIPSDMKTTMTLAKGVKNSQLNREGAIRWKINSGFYFVGRDGAILTNEAQILAKYGGDSNGKTFELGGRFISSKAKTTPTPPPKAQKKNTSKPKAKSTNNTSKSKAKSTNNTSKSTNNTTNYQNTYVVRKPSGGGGGGGSKEQAPPQQHK